MYSVVVFYIELPFGTWNNFRSVKITSYHYTRVIEIPWQWGLSMRIIALERSWCFYKERLVWFWRLVIFGTRLQWLTRYHCHQGKSSMNDVLSIDMNKWINNQSAVTRLAPWKVALVVTLSKGIISLFYWKFYVQGRQLCECIYGC